MHGFASYAQHWEYCDGIPVVSSKPAHFFKGEPCEDDLFKVPVYSYYDRQGDQRKKKGQQGKKQSRAVAKAVDEDLYKIPPELLYHQIPKRKRVLGNFLSACLGLNCIA